MNSSDTFSARAKDWDNPAKVAMTSAFVAKIKEKDIIDHNSAVMEIGCGTGLVGLEFAGIAERLTMVDTSEGMLDVFREKVTDRKTDNITIVHGDITLVKGRTDVIISFMTLHHIMNIGQLITDMNKRLARNGVIIVGDLYTEDGSFHSDTTVPHNGFEPEWLAGEFRNQGFRKVSFEPLTSVKKRGNDYGLFILIASK